MSNYQIIKDLIRLLNDESIMITFNKDLKVYAYTNDHKQTLLCEYDLELDYSNIFDCFKHIMAHHPKRKNGTVLMSVRYKSKGQKATMCITNSSNFELFDCRHVKMSKELYNAYTCYDEFAHVFDTHYDSFVSYSDHSYSQLIRI